MLALPILVGQLGSIATGFVDNVMVGRYSTEALASASFCNNVFNVAVLCCVGFTMGITPLVAAMHARGDSAGTGALMRGAARLNSVFCGVVMVLMAVVYVLLPHLGQPAELLPLIRPYFLISLAGLLPLTLFNVFEQWSFGVGNTMAPMWIILGGNLLNVLGNWLLIYGIGPFPELGLTGAGISTFLSRLVIAAAMAEYFRRRAGSACLDGYRRSRPDAGRRRKLFTTSLPVALQMSFETAAFSGAAVLCGLLGTVPLAAFQVIVVTGTLGFCLYYSLGAAVAIRVANAAGTGSTRLMRSRAWRGYLLMLLLMCCSSSVFLFGGSTIMSAFTDDPRVLTTATTLIFPLVLYQLGDATQINFANALRGTSRVMPMLWIAFVSYICLGLPSSWLLAFTAGLGIYGIVLSFSVSLFTAGALFLTFFLRATRPIPAKNDK